MLLNSGTAGGRSSLRPPNNDENAGKNLDEPHSTKKTRSVAFAPRSGNKKSNTGSKTPAQPQRRRALGDISNRKQGKSQGGGGTAAGGGTAKARSVTFQTPGRTGKVPGSTSQRTPFAPNSVAGSAKKKTIKTNTASNNIRPVLTPHHGRVTSGRDASIALPKRSVSFDAGLKPDAVVPKSRSTSDTTRAVNAPAAHVEDVELPAGRLWDGNSAFFNSDHGSFEELRELRGAREDVDAFLLNQREAHRKAREKYFVDADAALAEKMEKIALDDYEDVMAGMDKLFDRIEEDYDDDPVLHQSSDPDMYRRPIDDEFLLCDNLEY